MGRERKYRVWDNERQEMRGPSVNMLICSYSGRPHWQFAYDGPMPIDGEVMEWTGLKDSNGVEIWEGDILDGPTFGLRVVEYNQSTCGFNCLEALPEYGDDASVVVGNIYENPGLLPALPQEK